MQVKTILNRLQKHRGFVYGTVQLEEQIAGLALTVEIAPHRRNRPRCASCGQASAVYDRLALRRFEFVPLWGLRVFFPLPDAARRLPALWGHRRAGALGRRQAPADHHLHVVSRASVLADPQQALARRVDLVDEREELAPALPMDLVDADRANTGEIHVIAAQEGPGPIDRPVALQQQSETDHQKGVRLSLVSMPGNRSVPYTRSATGVRNYPQILLKTRRTFLLPALVSVVRNP